MKTEKQLQRDSATCPVVRSLCDKADKAEKLKPYIVNLCFTQHSTGTVIITARDMAHAELLADDIGAEDCENFDPIDGELSVGDIDQADASDIKLHDDFAKQELAKRTLEAAAQDMLEALKALFEHCSMIHNRWGEGCNNKQADAAIAAGHAAIAKAEGTA